MSGHCLNFDEPIRDAITRVRFAPQSNNLLISSWDSSIRLADVESGNVRLQAEIKAQVLDCCFQNESVALSAASDGSIFRYDLHNGAYYVIGKHEDTATCIEYSPETSLVITAGWDGKLLLWDSRSSRPSHALRGFDVHVESMSLSSIELLAATGSLFCKYDLRKLDEPILEDFSRRLRCVRSMTNQKGFAVGSLDGHVTLHSYSDETARYTFRCIPKSKEGNWHRHLVAVNDIAFNPSLPGVFVTGDYDGHVIAWDGSTQRLLLKLQRYPNSVTSLSYNYSGELLAVASSYAYQEANETEEPPQIFIQELCKSKLKSAATGSSSRR